MEKNYLLVALENTKLLTRLLVSGQYIRYDNIIPRDFVTTLLVNKNNFERSLATASIMSRGDKNNLVVLDIEEYNMNISSTSQYGTAKENVAVSLTGKDVRCAYNSKYLDDCLKSYKRRNDKNAVCPAQQLRHHHKQQRRGALLHSAGKADSVTSKRRYKRRAQTANGT